MFHALVAVDPGQSAVSRAGVPCIGLPASCCRTRREFRIGAVADLRCRWTRGHRVHGAVAEEIRNPPQQDPGDPSTVMSARLYREVQRAG